MMTATAIETPRTARSFAWGLESCGAPVMIVTHRRSGTHLLIDLVRRQFPACQSWKLPGVNTNRLYLPMGGLVRGSISKRAARRRLARPQRPILKTHSLPSFDLQQGVDAELVRWVRARGHMMYGTRDCRSVMASLYAYMQSFNPKASVAPGDFLRQTDPLPEIVLPADARLSRPAQWALHVREWRKEKDVLVVRFEDVLATPRAVVEAIANHLRMQPLLREPMLPARYRGTLLGRLGQRLALRPSSTAIVTPGTAAGEASWRELFSADDVAFIEQEAGEELAACGYAPARA